MIFSRRSLLVAAAGPLVLRSGIAAEPWPNKPVRIINPYPPGSPVDVVARYIASALKSSQTFIVDNVPGAGGAVGTMTALRATDGHTLLAQHTGSMLCGPLLYKAAEYNVSRDLRAIWALETSGLVLVVSKESRFSSLRDLIAGAKGSKPLAYASGGAGSPQHLAAAMLARTSALNTLHVPYRGAVPAQMALIGNEVDFLVDSISGAIPFIASGRMKALAVLRPTRFAGLRDVPTFAELGIAGANFPTAAIGLFAPQQSAAAASAEQLAAQLSRAYASDGATREQLAKIGLDNPVETADLDRRMQRDAQFFANLIRDEKIKIDS